MSSPTVRHNGRVITVEQSAGIGVSSVEIELVSDANSTIIEYSDVSPYTPDSPRSQAAVVFDPGWAKQEELKRLSDKDLRFPVVDISIQPDMEGLLELNLEAPGELCINGNFHPEMITAQDTVRIPANVLEHWDNAVLLDPNMNTIQSFSLCKVVETSKSGFTFDFEVLRDDWSGSVNVYSNDSQRKLLGRADIHVAAIPDSGSQEGGSERQGLLDSLSATVRYILECRNTKPDSPTCGGLFLLYDMAAKTRLRSDWPWTWGPAATLLLRASDIDGVDAGIPRDELRSIAIEIAEASLDQQITDPDHPAFGLVRTTNEPGSTSNHGFMNRASAADTLYLVGWGWMPFYRATGDKRFLEASQMAVGAAGRLMDLATEGMIPQAYDLKDKTWSSHMFFETSMGLGGLGQLFVETGDAAHKDIMTRFVDRLLDAFQREDGLWETMLYEETGSISTCNFFTKSFGYSAEGLMAVHEASPAAGYLERAEKIAGHILDAQAPDGSWPVRWDRPADEVGITDKGTALWALLFLKLYKITGKAEYRRAGMKALDWCMSHQYFGKDAAAKGGIVGRSWPSGIIYRYWFDMITTYTMAFFGNALVEALSMETDYSN